MKYTISEMSALLGVTTHMLRHYEKLGIISPEVDENNGYRYYTVLDTRRFNLSRLFLASGIPLNTCAELMNGNYSDEIITKVFYDQIEAIKKEQIRLKYVEEYLTNQAELQPVLKKEIGNVNIKYIPEPYWYLSLSNLETIDNESLEEEERSEWLKMMPAVLWVSKIPYQELIRFSSGKIGYHYGMMCKQSSARELGLKRTKNVEVIPAGNYASMLHIKKGRGPFTWEDIQKMTDYLKERGLQFFGDGYSTIVASYMENGEQINVHELCVKII